MRRLDFAATKLHFHRRLFAFLFTCAIMSNNVHILPARNNDLKSREKGEVRSDAGTRVPTKRERTRTKTTARGEGREFAKIEIN